MKLTPCEKIHHGLAGFLVLINTISVKYMLIVLSVPEMRYVSGKTVLDYYQNFRGILLFAVCAILLINFLIAVLNHSVRLEPDRYTFLIAAYLAVVGLSYIFSPYPATADEGFMETYEGVSVLISYGILMVTMSVMPMHRGVVTYYVAVFTATFMLVSGISVLQYFGADPLRWSVVKAYSTSAFMPTGPPENGYGNAAHGFFSNPNYLSSYFSMLLPGAYFTFLRLASRPWRAGLGVLIMMGHFSIFASGSASGLVLVVIGMFASYEIANVDLPWQNRVGWHLLFLLPALFFVVINHAAGYGKEALLAMAAYGAVAGTTQIVRRRRVGRRELLIAGLGAAVIGAYMVSLLLPVRPADGLTWIDNRQGVVQMTVNGNAYRVVAENGQVSVKNENNQISTAFPFHIEWEELPDRAVFKLIPGGVRFEVEKNNIFFLNSAGKRDVIVQPVFEDSRGLGHLGSGRVYIWLNALPLIAKHPILGTGPDTFGLVFPQNDVASKIRYTGNPYALATKAHNIYLNYAVNLGVVGMLLFTAIQTAVIHGLYRLNPLNPRNPHMLPLLIGLLLYAVVGLFNDSRIFLAIYHWTIMGIAVSMIRAGKTSEHANTGDARHLTA